MNKTNEMSHMMYKKLPGIVRLAVAQMADDMLSHGEKISHVAKEFHTSIPIVKFWHTRIVEGRLGVRMKGTAKEKIDYRAMPVQVKNAVIRLVQNMGKAGETMHSIARKIGSTDQSVKRWLEHGIPSGKRGRPAMAH